MSERSTAKSPQDELAEILAEAGTETQETEVAQESADEAEEKAEDEGEQESGEPAEKQPEAKQEPEAEQQESESTEQEQAEDGKPELPRRAKRRIDKLTKRLREAEERLAERDRMYNELRSETGKGRELEPDQREIEQRIYQSPDYQARLATASNLFNRNLQEQAPDAFGREVEFELGPMSQLALMEHPMGPRIALELMDNELASSMYDAATTDAQRVQLIQTIGSMISTKQPQRAAAQPKPAAVPQRKAPPAPTPKVGGSPRKVTPDPVDMPDRDFDKWLRQQLN